MEYYCTKVVPVFDVASKISHQTQGRESIAAKLVANIITEAGANRVLACDLHSGQSMGYFDIPVDHVNCHVGSFCCSLPLPLIGNIESLLKFVLFSSTL